MKFTEPLQCSSPCVKQFPCVYLHNKLSTKPWRRLYEDQGAEGTTCAKMNSCPTVCTWGSLPLETTLISLEMPEKSENTSGAGIFMVWFRKWEEFLETEFQGKFRNTVYTEGIFSTKVNPSEAQDCRGPVGPRSPSLGTWTCLQSGCWVCEHWGAGSLVRSGLPGLGPWAFLWELVLLSTKMK